MGNIQEIPYKILEIKSCEPKQWLSITATVLAPDNGKLRHTNKRQTTEASIKAKETPANF